MCFGKLVFVAEGKFAYDFPPVSIWIIIRIRKHKMKPLNCWGKRNKEQMINMFKLSDRFDNFINKITKNNKTDIFRKPKNP